MALMNVSELENKIVLMENAIKRIKILIEFLKTLDFITPPHMFFKKNSLRSTIEVYENFDESSLTFHLNSDKKGGIYLSCLYMNFHSKYTTQPECVEIINSNLKPYIKNNLKITGEQSIKNFMSKFNSTVKELNIELEKIKLKEEFA